jgi:hypothetical protein
MYQGSQPNEIENWVCVMERGTEYEVEIAKNYLADLDIPSNILSKRDSAISVNVGEMALVYLYVPREYEEEAREALEEMDLSAEDVDFDSEEE